MTNFIYVLKYLRMEISGWTNSGLIFYTYFPRKGSKLDYYKFEFRRKLLILILNNYILVCNVFDIFKLLSLNLHNFEALNSKC